MELILKYRNKIVALGLLPTIGTLIGLHFLPDTLVLGSGVSISLLALIYNITRFKTLNFFLLQGTVSIGLCLMVRILSSYELIPFGTITPVLEFFLLICAFIHITAPELYQQFLKRLGLYPCGSFLLEAKTVVILSGLHLLLLFLLNIEYEYPNAAFNFFMIYGIPIAIYILCLIINIVGIRIAIQEEFRYGRIRLAIICEGKIYLSPQKNDKDHNSCIWDTPMEKIFERKVQSVDRQIKHMIQSYQLDKQTLRPRHILTHQTVSDNGEAYPVWLYILPLHKMNNELAAGNGRWFSFKEICSNPNMYTPLLLSELQALKVAARMWKAFGE